MEVELKIDVAKKRFKAMQEKAKNPKYAMELIGAKAWRGVVQNFNLQQNEDGTMWKPLKHPRSGKRHKGSNPKPLLDTGYLRNSIRFATTPVQAKVFTNVSYAKYHDSAKPRTRLPRRQFMWISDKLRLQLLMNLLEYIKG